MRANAFFILFLLVLSSVCGYLLSKASLLGRTGIHFFYKEYRFLQVWWQGALMVFVVLVALFLIHYFIHKKLSRSTAVILHILALLIALAGLYFTYVDFREVLEHRLLGERFHLGAYLAWLGWIATSLFFLVKKKRNYR
jgi:hypothetical protein